MSWLFPFSEPYVGYPGRQPEFPSLHTTGTLTFFLVLTAVLLFGCCVICGMVGFAFYHITPRGRWVWGLHHGKWIFFTLYLIAGWMLLSPLNAWSESYIGIFGLLVIIPYFAIFWLLNRVGFYRIDYDSRTCLQVCDMGIPVVELGKHKGKVDVADCHRLRSLCQRMPHRQPCFP